MADNEQPIRFAERLNLALSSQKITARELAQITGISETSISKYRKHICMPGRGRIISLSKVLGVSPMWLLGYSDDMNVSLSPEEKLRNQIDGMLETMDAKQLQDALEFIEKYIVRK